MFQTFARSHQGLNISPGERSAMKLVEGWGLTAIGAGAGLVYQQLAVGSTDFHVILPPAIGAAILSVALSVKKFYAAQSDRPLSTPSLAGTPVDVPQAVQAQPSLPMPGTLFTTPVPQPFMAPPVVPLPNYAPPPSFDRNWSDMVPAMPTERIPAQ